MPEYLAPGVYVEEIPQSKSIEGVSTTTTGLIGPTRFGPVLMQPDIITSLGEFELVYGDGQQLQFGDDKLHNYSWHAVRAFFQEGGKRLYFSRVFREAHGEYVAPDDTAEFPEPSLPQDFDDGHARAFVGDGDSQIHIRARYPGEYGNMRVRFTVVLGQNILTTGTPNTVAGLTNRDTVWVGDPPSGNSPPGTGQFYIALWNQTSSSWDFKLSATATTGETVDSIALAHHQIRIATLTVSVTPPGGTSRVWAGLAPDPDHHRNGANDSMLAYFAPKPTSPALERSLPIVMLPGDDVSDGVALMDILLDAAPSLATNLEKPKSSDLDRSFDLFLAGGNDGARPTAAEYEGKAEESETFKTGLKQFEDIDDISIVAAPGSTYLLDDGYALDGETITKLLIGHCELMRYRVAILDSGNDQSLSGVRAYRGRLDSTRAALYYPWVTILDPITQAQINLPPSGFMAGIYARNDINRAVYKAPANEDVILSLGFESSINKAQQEVVNPEGINCFRYLPGRGFRIWGARTISSDPEWKYVNVRRYFAYLEHSIDKGTQWAVFEPNGPKLWDQIRHSISDFLLNEFQNGALLGDKPEKAYFVRCDRSTMTQNDLDNGRLVAVVGVAPLKPAEFVIIRIGQLTADSK
jgi:Bacteriophage tail sheath protein